MSENKVKLLEETKDEILKKIGEKVKADPNKDNRFGASHSSHTSSSKHSSQTH